jgi:phospholipid/cholesterol/gamma-HCH transport system ATP-binding protein
MIDIRGIQKSFDGKKVLRGVSLPIEKGETMVIMGPSGCGKSVLLKLIIGLLKPDAGEILIDGEDITRKSFRDLYRLRERFGMLFQSSALFDSMTVEENVGLPLREHTRMRQKEICAVVREKLRLVGLEGIERLKPAELSGGMRKRVGLARAIARDPQIVLYDEPTTGLDPVMADQINELIVELQRKLAITSVAVTHDIKSAFHIADRVAMLHQGKILAVGSPRDIQAHPESIVQQFILGQSNWDVP